MIRTALFTTSNALSTSTRATSVIRSEVHFPNFPPSSLSLSPSLTPLTSLTPLNASFLLLLLHLILSLSHHSTQGCTRMFMTYPVDDPNPFYPRPAWAAWVPTWPGFRFLLLCPFLPAPPPPRLQFFLSLIYRFFLPSTPISPSPLMSFLPLGHSNRFCLLFSPSSTPPSPP